MTSKVIVFDLDGVLFDTAEHALQFFLDLYPTLTKGKMDEILCGNFHDELAKFKKDNVSINESEEQMKKLHAEYSEKKSQLPLFKGVKELLETLHRSNFTLTINTSALERNCLPLLERVGISKYFDFVATKETSKNKTEKFKLIAERYDVQPSKMIFITDTLGDVREAEVAGVPTITVTWGAHNRSFFEREPHKNLVKVVESVSELGDCLVKHANIM